MLQCCAGDQRSLLSAAQAHSRLHQAAVLALHSIRADVPQQQQVDCVLGYLAKHGSQVHSLDLSSRQQVTLYQLPPILQLTSLQLRRFSLQLQPACDSMGVLGAAATIAALKHLQLQDCLVIDDDLGFTAALQQLPTGLEHLSISGVHKPVSYGTCIEQLCQFAIPTQAVQHLQRLTCLALKGFGMDPAVLAGKTLLQHLQLEDCWFDRAPRSAVSKLMAHLQPLQQLTSLNLHNSALDDEDSQISSPRYWTGEPRPGSAPVSAYEALTASSKLQHLDLSLWKLPLGVWQHLFPAGRQLPHLTSPALTFVTGWLLPMVAQPLMVSSWSAAAQPCSI